MKMGTSLDKNDHPKSYYLKLYLEKYNAKNKITRSNNPFSREHLLRTKRERKDVKAKKEDKDYEIEENESNDDEVEENDDIENLDEESNESDQETEGKKNSKVKLRKSITKEIQELNKNYKDSGIKYTRLILQKKKKIEEPKKLFINEENTLNKTATSNKNAQLEFKEQESPDEKYKNEVIKVSPLKQSKKIEQINNLQNNEFIPENKDIIQTPNYKNENENKINDIGLKVNPIEYSEDKSHQEQKQILFGAPKSSENKYNINLSANGPISFGFNQTTNSKFLENSEYNKDKNEDDINENKRYNTFVKNVSEAVKNNINKSQKSEREKAKTILLKWESPKQKEFLRQSMDMDDNDNNMENTNNIINTSYDFNARINNSDNDNLRLGKGFIDQKQKNLFNNNYMEKIPEQGQNIQNDYIENDYKSKLRSYDKKKQQNNQFDNEENAPNYNEYNIPNPFYSNIDTEKNQTNNYIEDQDIYGDSLKQKNNLFPNNIYYGENKNFNENMNIPMEKNNYEIKYLAHNNEPQANLFSNNNEDNAQYQETLNDKIKYYNKDENMNMNLDNENNIYEQESEINSYIDKQNQIKRKEKFFKKVSEIKNNVMNKFKNKVYLWPLLLLMLFGIVYFLNNTYERFEPAHIIIVFSILMGLLVLYNIIRYCLTIKKYKKIARADRTALLERLNNENITNETLMNNIALLNNFISQRIEGHNLDRDEYMKYVFPYLKKYLKKDGFVISVDENDNNNSYWKEI